MIKVTDMKAVLNRMLRRYLRYLIVVRTIKLIFERLYMIYASALYPLILRIGKSKEPSIDKNKSKRSLKIIYDRITGESRKILIERLFNTKQGWGNIEITKERYADYYLIINRPLELFSSFSYYNPKRTLLYYSEPLSYVNRMGKWGNPDEKDFFYVSKMPLKRMLTFWFLGKSYHWLKENTNP